MSAIQTIIETYIRFADEQALLNLKVHRLKLPATISESDPFFKSLRSQCVEDISVIEAGLVRLRPPAAPLPDVVAPEPVLPNAERSPAERASGNPGAGHHEKNVVGNAGERVCHVGSQSRCRQGSSDAGFCEASSSRS
jgi:hypothetical protein